MKNSDDDDADATPSSMLARTSSAKASIAESEADQKHSEASRGLLLNNALRTRAWHKQANCERWIWRRAKNGLEVGANNASAHNSAMSSVVTGEEDEDEVAAPVRR